MNEKKENTRGADYLTETEKQKLIAVFNNKADYIRHMQTLWALRAEALRRCEEETPAGLSYDKENPLFRLADMANELINALGFEHNNIFFEDNGHYWERATAEAHRNSPKKENNLLYS